MIAFAVFAACDNSPAENDQITDALVARVAGPAPTSARFRALQRLQPETLQVGFLSRGVVGAVLLDQRDGAFETWLSPDRATITFENGLLHNTRGLGAGLLATELSQSSALVRSRQEGFADRLMTFLNGNDVAVTRTFRCAVSVVGPRDVTLNTGVVPATLMRENCKSLDEEFTNRYWVDGQGNIIQSSQWTGAFLGAISTRIVR